MIKDRAMEEKAFLQAIAEGKNQKQACELVGWDKAKGSRFLKRIREEEPERLHPKQEAPEELNIFQKAIEQERTENVMKGPEKKATASYIKFNLAGYADYVKTMAGFRKTSVTEYIRALIAADMEKNLGVYEKLKDMQ